MHERAPEAASALKSVPERASASVPEPGRAPVRVSVLALEGVPH